MRLLHLQLLNVQNSKMLDFPAFCQLPVSVGVQKGGHALDQLPVTVGAQKMQKLLPFGGWTKSLHAYFKRLRHQAPRPLLNIGG